MCKEQKELPRILSTISIQNIFLSSLISSFCLLFGIVLKFCEKCEGRYKLILVKNEYLIDIRKDKGSYCGVYLDREVKSSFIL
jgi:hypothetical protein